MPVIVKYDSGFDTKLLFHSQLEAAINAKGSPILNPDTRLLVFPDGTSCTLKKPFPGDQRTIVKLETVPWNKADEHLREKLRVKPEVRRCYCH